MKKTAILVDGGFYRLRAKGLYGPKTPSERARELENYCKSHLSKIKGKEGDKGNPLERSLYRVFYYDCPPYEENVYNPITKRAINYGTTDIYYWMTDFLKELKEKRKFALRMGRISSNDIGFHLDKKITNKLLSGKKLVEDITEGDLSFSAMQKGVDMKLGLDIASLAFKRQVDQIILISGDSDFVPAAKMARKEGIDFILDPMQQEINADLKEHIDGIQSPWKPKKQKDKEDE